MHLSHLSSRIPPHLCRSALRCTPAGRRSGPRPPSARTGRARTADPGTSPPAPPAGDTTHRHTPPRSRSGTSARPTPHTRPSHTWVETERGHSFCPMNTSKRGRISGWAPYSLAAVTGVGARCRGDNIAYRLVAVLTRPTRLAVTLGTLRRHDLTSSQRKQKSEFRRFSFFCHLHRRQHVSERRPTCAALGWHTPCRQ